PQEEGEVVPLGEAGQVGRVVQPDVDQPLDAGGPQRSEELLGRVPGETDRTDLHDASPPGANSDGCSAPAVAVSSSSSIVLPSPRRWTTPMPSSRRTRAISSRRWQPVGSSSLHMSATRQLAAPRRTRS